MASHLREVDHVIDLVNFQNEDQLKRRFILLLRDLVPSWRKVPEDANIEVERISGALTNCVYSVSWPPGEDLPSSIQHSPPSKSKKKPIPTSSTNYKVLVRVFGEGSSTFVDREDELKWLSHLSQHRLAPALLGVFANGRVEEFVEAETLTKITLRQPDVSSAIAGKLFKLHMLGDCLPENQKPNQATTPVLWDTVFKWYHSVMAQMETIAAHNPSHNQMFESFDFEKMGKDIIDYKKHLSTLDSPLVFCHNDLQYGNILQMDNQDIVIVDFEYSGYNYRGYDIGNHFCEWMADYHSSQPHLLHPEKYPSKEEQLRFLSSYLQAYEIYNHIHFCEEEREMLLEQLYLEVNKFGILSHVVWGLWGLLQSINSTIHFDYFAYGMQRLWMFHRLKARMQRL